MKQRITTAIIALIIFIPFVYYGQWPFIIFGYILASVGLFELLKMNHKNMNWVVTCLSFICLWMMLLPTSDVTIYSFTLTKTDRSEEHTSELQSRGHLVCRLLLEKKKQI